jgi:hypothetical protein
MCTASRAELNCQLTTHWVKVKVKVTLQLTVSQPVRLGVEPHYYSLAVTVLFLWGALSDDRTGSVFCICCWHLPAQSFSGPSAVRLVTIFYCLRFETSLFVASYDSRGYGGGIQPRLHTVSDCDLKLVSLITSRHGPRKKHSSPLL